MQFKNQSQVRACFAQYQRDIKEGRIPSWDCYKWLDETRGNIKDKKSKSKVKSYIRLSPKKSLRKRKVHTGPRGGKYVLIKGHKVYI
jgi:hypothetical protein